MELILESQNIEDYLISSDVIDYDNEVLQRVANNLAKDKLSHIDIAKEVYEYVRDRIHHSGDINAALVTTKATEVLEKQHGICCAKSHLLAALLRYKGIPTGFCYQKLYSEDNGKPYVAIHGLNAIYLKEISKWIRVDARGNKEGVYAEFNTEIEMIAWPINLELGEEDIPIVYVSPNELIVRILKNCKNRDELHRLWITEAHKAF